MPISNDTRAKLNLPPDVSTEVATAFGVTSHKNLFSKAEEDLLTRGKKALSSKALTIEDDPWDLLPKEKRVDLLRPAYEPIALINLCHTNNTLGQLIDAMEVNIDGTGYDIEPKDEEEPDEATDDPEIYNIKEFFD